MHVKVSDSRRRRLKAGCSQDWLPHSVPWRRTWDGGHHRGLEAERRRNPLKTKRLDSGTGPSGVLRFKLPFAVTKDLAETRAMSLPFDIEKQL
jgi:hypothetical protein